MTTERVGALRYDVILNTHSLKKGATDARSAFKTFRDGMKSATTATERYQAGMENVKRLFKDKSITKEQGQTLVRELNKELEREGFIRVGINKFEKTNIKLKEEELAAQKKINREADLEKQIRKEMSKQEERHLSGFRNRKRKSHSEIMDRALQIRKVNAKSHQILMLNMRQRMRAIAAVPPGMAAGIAGNIAGAMGASGATIGAVRGAAMLGIKKALPIAGIIGMGLALKKAVFEADRLQRSMIDLGVLMGGDASNAKRLVKELQKLARTTPLATGQLVEGARQLMSFGRASSKVTEDLRILGTIAGGDAERMRLLTKAFGDVIAAGKLQGQELRQMTNQGFNPLREMVELTGKSYADLRLEMERGNITAKMVFDSMASAAEGYAGRLEASMDTVSGQLQRLQGLIQEAFATGGSGYVNPTAKGLELLGDLTEGSLYYLEKMQEGGLVVGRAAAETAEGIRRLFSGEDASEIFSMEGLEKFREEQGRLSAEYQNRLIDEKLASEEAVRTRLRGDADAYNAVRKQQDEITGEIAKQIVAREEFHRLSLGITKEEVQLAKLKNQFVDAEKLGQEEKAQRLKESIELQKELMEEQKKLENAKKVAQIEIDYINEVYDLEEKRIDKSLKKRTDAAMEEFRRNQELAELARRGGVRRVTSLLGGQTIDSSSKEGTSQKRKELASKQQRQGSSN